MDRLRRQLSQAPWAGYSAALAAVVLLSLAIGLVLWQVDIANISMLYLIVVLVSATAFGSGPAILASVAAFLVFNWFFVEPQHTLTVNDPAQWVALLLFLLTALITGQLAAGQRRRQKQAEQREREAIVLYNVVRLLREPDLNQALQAVAERLRGELQLAVVAVRLAEDDRMPAQAVAGDQRMLPESQMLSHLSPELLSAGPSPTGTSRGSPGRWVRIVHPKRPGSLEAAAQKGLHVVPVNSQGRRVGALVLVQASDAPGFEAADDRLLSAVAAQLGIAVERRNLRREATEAEILRRTDDLRTALLNAVSHDLRTPLASIMASADSLLQKDVDWTEQERDEFTRAIGRETRRLNRIVGNLLDLSRIQSGSIRPELDWYHLGALIDDVLGRLRPTTAQHHIVLDVQEDLPPVPLDYVEIDQVLSNLIENAAKYSEAGTEIQISARQDGGEVRVEVADRGSGIPAEALSLLFKPFSRLEGKGPRPKGTGLGLAVARGLVEAHGGRIWAENRRDGGASFIFTLPLSPRSRPIVA